MSGHDSLTDRTADLMGLADVHRWNVIKTTRTQSVAEHSFNTAIIVAELCQRLELDGDTTASALWWALVHDAPETLTGDIDGKFKRDHPSVKQMIEHAEISEFKWWQEERINIPASIFWLVKAADRIEAIQFIRTWGIGARADDVYQELVHLTFDDKYMGVMASGIKVEPETLAGVMRHILNHSVSEQNCIQMRRFRKMGQQEDNNAKA